MEKNRTPLLRQMSAPSSRLVGDVDGVPPVIVSVPVPLRPTSSTSFVPLTKAVDPPETVMVPTPPYKPPMPPMMMPPLAFEGLTCRLAPLVSDRLPAPPAPTWTRAPLPVLLSAPERVIDEPAPSTATVPTLPAMRAIARPSAVTTPPLATFSVPVPV